MSISREDLYDWCKGFNAANTRMLSRILKCIFIGQCFVPNTRYTWILHLPALFVCLPLAPIVCSFHFLLCGIISYSHSGYLSLHYNPSGVFLLLSPYWSLWSWSQPITSERYYLLQFSRGYCCRCIGLSIILLSVLYFFVYPSYSVL